MGNKKIIITAVVSLVAIGAGVGGYLYYTKVYQPKQLADAAALEKAKVIVIPPSPAPITPVHQNVVAPILLPNNTIIGVNHRMQAVPEA